MPDATTGHVLLHTKRLTRELLSEAGGHSSRQAQVSAALAEEGADTVKLMARMDELQTRIDAANGWEIERTLQRATDALRCPPGLVKPSFVDFFQFAAAAGLL